MIVDAQSVKNTDTAGQKGYDAGKRVSGIKRHIAVDTEGLPHAVAITTADVTGCHGATAALHRCADRLRQVTGVLADGGYSGSPFADMPRRWIVERFFAWLEKCRRLWKNRERKLNTSLQMVHLAFLILLLGRS